MCDTEVQMSEGGWARLRKQQQQQQENTLIQADGNEYQVLAQSMMNKATLASTLPIRVSMLQVDQGDLRASKLLQIVRRWKTQSGAKQTTSRSPRSTTSSTSCSRLNFVPLSCITFSSIQSYSDHDDEEEVEDDAGSRTDLEADSRSKINAKSPAPPLQLSLHRSRSAQTAEISSHQYTTKNSTQCTGKERDSFCERKVRGAACRALYSCRKLGSPLRSCTTFPSMKADGELESLKPKLEEEAGHSLKLRRSSSSPLRRPSSSSSSLRRSSSSPLKRHSTPKGYLALYVGEERRRFLVKANSLNHPLFSVLLEKAKEEFGFDQKGPLNIPCEIPFFQHILLLVESNDPSSQNADHMNSSL